MKIYLPIIILLIFAFVNFVSAQTAAEITEISLQDDGGFGFERGDKIKFFSDGSAEYFGGKNSYGLKGKYRGQIKKSEFVKLANFIVKEGFFKFKDLYETQANDAATITTTVIYKGGQKSVVNFANTGDAKLSAVHRAINALGAKVKWEKVE